MILPRGNLHRCVWGDYLAPNQPISTFKADFKPHSGITPRSKQAPKSTSILPENAGPPTLKSLTQDSFMTPGIVANEGENAGCLALGQKVGHSVLGHHEIVKQPFSNISRGTINPDRRIETRNTTFGCEFMPIATKFARNLVTRQQDLASSDLLGKHVFDATVSEYNRQYQGIEGSIRKCYSERDVPGE